LCSAIPTENGGDRIHCNEGLFRLWPSRKSSVDAVCLKNYVVVDGQGVLRREPNRFDNPRAGRENVGSIIREAKSVTLLAGDPVGMIRPIEEAVAAPDSIRSNVWKIRGEQEVIPKSAHVCCQVQSRSLVDQRDRPAAIGR
jgi:hypothetical protein